MYETTIALAGRGPGTAHSLVLFSFGNVGAEPHVHVQAGLHADEGPGMLAARLLIDHLMRSEAAGQMRGRVTVVPAANPIGLNQFVMGEQQGRFDLLDGRNFNRDYPDLFPGAAARLEGRLGTDALCNVVLIRKALLETLGTLPAHSPGVRLRHILLQLALPADVVIDLHSDGEALVHMYTQPGSQMRMAPLAALTGCRAVLLADVSGGNPFDEAVSRPWLDLARRFEGVPVPPACASCTLELRGRGDVCRVLAAADAAAIMGALSHMGVIAAPPPALPEGCTPTPLAASEALEAPCAGLLSYRAVIGEIVSPGDLIAEISDPLTGSVTPVRASTGGLFYARPATRIAEPGKRLGKIAGTLPFRAGQLLSP